MSKESIEIDSDVLDSEINLKKTDSIDDILVQIEKYTQSTNLLSSSSLMCILYQTHFILVNGLGFLIFNSLYIKFFII